ncbi:MAG: bifunctional diaminohydroxyphosphoribosylaminopyrimidine deaminase/5-amino-6-(5-phosphoribosylamino)uracil reductase RibD [Verrucomicrobia bacterium]|nr:bifunctional diaminohydroxyphosphoribosylaminopyrimidine deaminase/5-amino-6-(5-phosphoribosylamino)uracil reductase RibD [Verrucomicrobiota bacterium]
MHSERDFMRLALRLARRGYGTTSPNPMVGAVLVKRGRIIGRGWHHRAGEPHAELEALRDAQARGQKVNGATLYVTLEPCCTHGRTPPCTEAIVAAGLKRVVVGTVDPNPRHRGRAFKILRQAGVAVTQGALAEECALLNEAFNHWIVQRTPLVTVKAGMTLDGKIATASGESKWITGEKARVYGMRLRQGADAILVGINTVLADDPSLTFRSSKSKAQAHRLRRIVLDARGRTPIAANVVSDEHAALTMVVVNESAPKRRVAALAKHVSVLVAPGSDRTITLPWLLKELGSQNVTSLLVEGGGEVNASFLLQGLAQRVAFFYAPMILGGRDSRRVVAGEGARTLAESLSLGDLHWRRLGPDWLLRAGVLPR